MIKLDAGINYARFAMDTLTVVALCDGFIDMPTSRLRREGNHAFGSDLPAQVELADGKLRLSVNAFLVVDQDQHILIDTGTSNSWEPTMGSLLVALDEAGIERGAIGTVALTHTHEDHAHGLVAADGSDAFPKLTRLFVPKEEIPLFDRIERLSRFRERRMSIEDGFKLSSRIVSVAAHGHEIGHTAYEIKSGGETLLVWGDIVHIQSIQFSRPELTWEYDANQPEARATRQKMLRRASQPNHYVAGAHLAFPGIGTVTEHDGAYRYTPA